MSSKNFLRKSLVLGNVVLSGAGIKATNFNFGSAHWYIADRPR
jgi:hypothetical protein